MSRPETLLATGVAFTIYENKSGFRVVRLFDGAECTFYGDDQCERFRDNFTGDESPETPADNLDEADEFGVWCEENGELPPVA